MLGVDKDEFLRSGHDLAKRLFPGILTMEGVGYGVARSAVDRQDNPGVGGFEPETVVTIRMLVEELEGDPPLETVVDLDGERLRTKRVTRDPGGVTWGIELESA